MSETSTGTRAVFGVLAALPGELGALRGDAHRARDVRGLTLHETDLDPGTGRVVAIVSGVGKVAAAEAAAVLVAEGATTLLVVGTCGAVRRADEVGDLVHVREAIQWDLAVREGRSVAPDEAVQRAWAEVAPGKRAVFLTADRPAIRLVERLRRARATRSFAGGTVVADMETAAVGAVASRAGVPWGALRVVSDRRPRVSDLVRPSARRSASFQEGYRLHAARPADSVPELCRRLSSLAATTPEET